MADEKKVDPTKDAAKAAAGTKGGYARAEVLSPEARREIAINAAAARWERGDSIVEAIVGTPADKPLVIAGVEFPAFVLADGRRVFAQKPLVRGLDMSPGSAGTAGGDRLGKFVRGKRLAPFVSSELLRMTDHPIRFRTRHGGGIAYGYEATVLAEICDAVMAARVAGVMDPRSKHIAMRCEALMRSFARVGIVALVDEATGYQAIRPADALQRYLEMILRKELAAWAKKFPDEFYENIYKLKGWPWPGMQKNRYSVVAYYTRDLVYERIAPGLLNELETRSPKNQNGVRPYKLQQWLNELGDALLAQHLYSLVMFQRLAIANGFGWHRFVKMVDQVLPKKGQVLDLPFADEPLQIVS
jgi:hypothetical protein